MSDSLLIDPRQFQHIFVDEAASYPIFQIDGKQQGFVISPPKPRTLAELTRTNFAPFRKWDDATFKAQIAAIEYIESMAGTLKIDIRNWDLIETFAHPQDADRIVVDKRAINKRLYARGEQEKQGIPPELAPLEKQLIELAISNAKRAKEELRETIAIKVRDYSERCSYLSREHTLEMERYWGHKRKLAALENQLDPKTDFLAIQKVIQTERWKLGKTAGENIELISAQDAILTEKNPAAGVDLRVNFGTFRVKLSLKSYLLEVHPHEKNTFYENFYHPYISYNGNICWGNAQDTANKMHTQGDIFGLFVLLDSLLHSYSPDTTPYQSLVDFQRMANEVVPEAQNRRATCWTCEYCDELVRETETCPRCCIGCGNRHSDCNCCSICGDNSDECSCCTECMSTDDNCDRCAECGSHSHGTDEHGSENQPPNPEF